MGRVNSVLELIGGTPVVRIQRAVDPRASTLWAKLEAANPGGSVKDRIALAMIEAAERAGQITPGRTVIVEATSGNTGVGLALACAVKGYRLILTMPDDQSEERRRLLAAYGAELELTPAAEVMGGALRRARELLQRLPEAWCPAQFDNPANPAAHGAGTGPELIAAFEDIGLDGFVAGIGTGGTLSGAGRALRARWPGLQLWGVEPAESPVLSGGSPSPHPIQGIGAGFVPANLDLRVVDQIVPVSGPDAAAGARALARAEGLLVGISSGATFVAARRLALELGPGRHVCFLCASTGERYLSTGLFG
jgi:cysteine synthase A